ncbi:MAG TPA: hypothetical protein VMY05_03020 [Acidobacteriota bacterium]|nr:hypothetical protein [Acidobacteriota bacterium]
MAKKQTFADKLHRKTEHHLCPVCKKEVKYVRHVKAVKSQSGAWKFRSVNTGVCECNEKEIYA